MFENIQKVLDFVKNENLGITTNNGLIITDQEGCIIFQSNSLTKCFNQACEWIDGNILEATM